MNCFGEFLYALRKERGMTQAELADRLGLTNKAVSKWETGEAFPETSQLVPLSKMFGVTVDELLNGCRQGAEQFAAAESAGCAEKPYQLPANEQNQPPRWKKQFAVMMGVGLALIFLGVIAVIVAQSIFGEDTLIGVFVLFGLVAAAVFLFVYAGMLNSKLYLPVDKPDWKRRVKIFAVQIGFGVVMLFVAAMFFVAGGYFPDDSAGAISFLVIGLATIAAAVCLLTVSGIRWEGYYRQASPEQYGREKKAESEFSVRSAVCGGIMLLAVLAFLLAGFLGGYWHPGWVAFPAGGILCGIVSPFFNKKEQK